MSTFEQKLAKATCEMSREFFVWGGLAGLIVGVVATVVVQAVFA